jgi:biofilm protein TabA
MKYEKMTPARAEKWFKEKEWVKGLSLEAHPATDVLEFSFQYAKCRECWDKAFTWLRDTNLAEIAPVKYKIDDDLVFASVAEGNTKNPEDTRWEAHKKYIDIQYVATGKEKIGVAPLSKAVAIEPFNEAKDIGFYEIPEADCVYHTAQSGIFFVFFSTGCAPAGDKSKGIRISQKNSH